MAPRLPVSLTSTVTSSRLWRDIPFSDVKDAVLGKDYTLSLAFVSPAESKKLNKKYRKKEKPANVLSFPLEKKSGEIIICPAEATKQAPSFDLSPARFVALLFIHGLFHLKGERHGSTMEKHERAIQKRFSL